MTRKELAVGSGLALLCYFSVLFIMVSGNSPKVPPPPGPAVYRHAQAVIQDEQVKVPWDGRYSDYKGEFCVEVFNGTGADIRQYGHGVPPGFYLRVCDDGNYYTNDGKPFRGMRGF